jgi:hypothetical protein
MRVTSFSRNFDILWNPQDVYAMFTSAREVIVSTQMVD